MANAEKMCYLCAEPGCPNYVNPTITPFCPDHTRKIRQTKPNRVVDDEYNLRFDLEQAILDCWHITSDVRYIIDNFENTSPEKIETVLRGLEQLYEMKFDTAFSLFETFVKERHHKNE